MISRKISALIGIFYKSASNIRDMIFAVNLSLIIILFLIGKTFEFTLIYFLPVRLKMKIFCPSKKPKSDKFYNRNHVI